MLTTRENTSPHDGTKTIIIYKVLDDGDEIPLASVQFLSDGTAQIATHAAMEMNVSDVREYAGAILQAADVAETAVHGV